MHACLQEQGCKYLESQECYYTRGEQYKLGLAIHSYLVVLVSTHNFNLSYKVDCYRICCSCEIQMTE